MVFGAIAIPSSIASLTENSPFLPPDFTPGGSSAPSQSNQPTSPVERLLDFKGWYEISGEKRFLVAPKRRSDGGWLRMGESRNEITVLDFDPAEERVRVSFQGNEGWLEITQLESNSSGATASTSQSSDGSTASSSSPTTRPSRATPTRGRVSPVPQRRTVTSTSRSTGPGSTRQAVPPRIADRAGRAPQGPPTPPPSGPPPSDVPTGRPDSDPPRERPNTQNINIIRE